MIERRKLSGFQLSEFTSKMWQLLIGMLLLCLPAATQVSPYAGKIKHVIIIIQENHSFDHYFGHLTGIAGNPVTTAKHNGIARTLTHENPAITYNDLPHTYTALTADIDGGKMDGFPLNVGAYSYYDCGDIPFYCDMASTFGLATNYWPQRGPSYPAHMGFIAAPRDIVDNPNTVTNHNRWTCFSTQTNGTACTGPGCIYGTTVGNTGGDIVNDIQNYPANTSVTMYHAGICADEEGIACTDANALTVCANHGGACNIAECKANTQGCICPSVTTVGANLSLAGVSHLWYGPGKNGAGAFWEAPYYEQAAAFGSEASHMALSGRYMTDVSGNALPVISWISPATTASEHPGDGPISAGAAQTAAFIAQCFNNHVNCYDHALILLTWDDSGGYYDHVAPTSTQDGIRVPLICIGPYCKQGFNSTYLTQGGVLKCVEDIAGIHYIGPLDTNAKSVCAADGSAMINLSQTPIPVPTSFPSASLRDTEFRHNNPDVVDGLAWAWHKLHRDHDDARLPQLASITQRPCDPATPLRDWAMFVPTGERMQFCHDPDNKYVLFPGQTLDDADDADDLPKQSKQK